MFLKRFSCIYLFLILRVSLFFKLMFSGVNIFRVRLVNADGVSVKSFGVRVFGEFIGPRLIGL